MKIITSYPNMFWSIDAECMAKFKKDIILLQFECFQKEEKVYSIDVSVRSCGLGQDFKQNKGGRQYAEVKKYLPEILKHIKRGEDVLVLADTNPQSVIIFELLKRISNGDNFKLHFMGITPLKFESKLRKQAYQDLLNGNGRVKSLYLKLADDYFNVLDRRTTMPQLLEKIKADLESDFSKIEGRICSFKPKIMYFFDNRSKKYVDAKLALRDWEKDNSQEELYRMGEMDLNYNPSTNERELVEQLTVRSNGNDICKKLRELRKKFAEANSIVFESSECSYEGPCAGTCEKCDAELRYLNESIKLLKKESYFPYLEIAESRINIKPVDLESTAGYLKASKKTIKELTGIQIPEFLKKKTYDEESTNE